jgi:glycosyltransferase involved in cell wall biosynthesis
MTARGITIVVPAFDEQDGIEGVVSRLSGLALRVPVEILVVDDGSTDGTVAVLERIGPRYPKLRVIRHDRNRGYGAALKTGFANARHEVVVITDADGTYPENRIAELLARIDAGAEMAVGARTGPEVEVPLLRRPAKWILRMLASYLAGVRIPDLNSGLRAIRRDLVTTYRPILSDGFSFTTTITLSALTNGHRVDWVSIDYKKRQGLSKIRPIRDTLGFTSLIVRTVLYFNPLKVFFPAAFVLGLALAGSLYIDVFVTSPPNLSEKTILCFVALIQVLTVGLLADLVDKRSRL